MGRKDWYYPNIPLEMADALDTITAKSGKKYGIYNKGQLITSILADFISRYEETKNIMGSIKEANPTSSTKKVHGKRESAVLLLEIVVTHLEEKDCKHTIKEISSEWIAERQKRNPLKSI